VAGDARPARALVPCRSIAVEWFTVLGEERAADENVVSLDARPGHATFVDDPTLERVKRPREPWWPRHRPPPRRAAHRARCVESGPGKRRFTVRGLETAVHQQTTPGSGDPPDKMPTVEVPANEDAQAGAAATAACRSAARCHRARGCCPGRRSALPRAHSKKPRRGPRVRA
jgi:hypothetical protein